MNEDKNTQFIAQLLEQAADALNTANLVASTDSTYYGALTLATLAVKEAQRSVVTSR